MENKYNNLVKLFSVLKFKCYFFCILDALYKKILPTFHCLCTFISYQSIAIIKLLKAFKV